MEAQWLLVDSLMGEGGHGEPPRATCLFLLRRRRVSMKA